MSGDILVFITGGEGLERLLLATSGERPEMLLTIQQCTEQPRMAVTQPKMSVVPRWRNPELDRPLNITGNLMHSYLVDCLAQHMTSYTLGIPTTAQRESLSTGDPEAPPVAELPSESAAECGCLKGLPFLSDPGHIPSRTGHHVCHLSIYVYANHT